MLNRGFEYRFAIMVYLMFATALYLLPPPGAKCMTPPMRLHRQ
jgi:hypothetical protein